MSREIIQRLYSSLDLFSLPQYNWVVKRVQISRAYKWYMRVDCLSSIKDSIT